MKKHSKKLALASETIRELRILDLARGGMRQITHLSCGPNCEPPTTY